MKKAIVAAVLCLTLAATFVGGCCQAGAGQVGSSPAENSGSVATGQNAEAENGSSGTSAAITDSSQDGTIQNMSSYPKMTVDVDTVYQTIESFGTSGCWWSQYVGGFDDDPYGETGISTREQIAGLLFDREKGIGLTCYRYNLGAGSAQSRKGSYSDIHRRAQNFETEPGIYDWDKDANAVWFLNRAVELGVQEVVLFCNSPLERLTDNGMAQMTAGTKSNISPENYGAFATYVMDVAEHFVSEGIPVRFISPINEPQWEWVSGQEGAHYEPEQTREVYLAFLDELESRDALAGVELSGPESGEWGGQATIDYTESILGDDRLAKHFTAIDNHSYWSDDVAKQAFANYMKVYHPDVKLRMSEWCEMVNGSDVTMDSAFHLAQEIANDMRILSVVSWQNWVAVAPGGYRDGLIYIDERSHKFRPLKRLYSFGNFSRYVRPGYQRVKIEAPTRAMDKMLPTAFVGVNDEGKEELVMVFINEDVLDQEFVLDGCGEYARISCYETSDNNDLACVLEGEYNSDTAVKIAARSVTTVVLEKP